MRSTYDRSLVNRMLGIARFESAAYSDVANDTSATLQAAAVVAIASLSSGLGSLDDGGVTHVLGGIITGMVAWIVLSVAAYVIGTQFFGSPVARVEMTTVVRVLGFAYTPLALSIFGILPFFGNLVLIGAWVWWLAASVVAVRRTVGIALIGALVTVIGAMIATGVIALILWAITGISII